MEELKKYRAFFLISSAVIISVGVIAFIFFNITQTGPLGDTLGGIFSPFVGLFSAVLIYETFKAQREQLDDQKSANAYSKSSFYYNELKQLYENVNAYSATFSFNPIHNGHTYTHMGAVQGFIDSYKHDVERHINDSGLGLIRLIIAQLKLLLSITERTVLSRGLLIDNELQLLMQDHLQGSINNCTRHYDPLFDIVRKRLDYIRGLGFTPGATNSEPNVLIAYFQVYYGIMESFERLGYVKKSEIENVNSDGFFDDTLNSALKTLDLKSNFISSIARLS